MNGWSESDQGFMRAALDEAAIAADSKEVPVGAVVVQSGEIIARGRNRTLADNDPTAHAEVVAVRAAAIAMENHRLPGSTLFVTLEPCPMCVGAMLQARVARVVFAAYDARAGALGSVIDISMLPQLNHRLEVNGGLFAEEAGDLLSAFFEQRR